MISDSPSNNLLNGLPPVADSKSLVLILGTFPGPMSLRREEYYSDPKNRFWQILCGVLRISGDLSYNQRKAKILNRRIALWDVINRCRRPGSKDKDIMDPVVNDLVSFLQNHQTIKHIIFNGKGGPKSAFRWAKNLIPGIFELSGKEFHRFTSTSGLNTHYTINQKVECWSQLRNYLLCPINSDVHH